MKYIEQLEELLKQHETVVQNIKKVLYNAKLDVGNHPNDRVIVMRAEHYVDIYKRLDQEAKE